MSGEETGSVINPKLIEVCNQLLEEVFGAETHRKKKKPGRKSAADIAAEEAELASGEQKYTLDDKLKVLDRVLKLEQLRLKVREEGEGSGFGDD